MLAIRGCLEQESLVESSVICATDYILRVFLLTFLDMGCIGIKENKRSNNRLETTLPGLQAEYSLTLKFRCV